jgi:hypothetical protein
MVACIFFLIDGCMYICLLEFTGKEKLMVRKRRAALNVGKD